MSTDSPSSKTGQQPPPDVTEAIHGHGSQGPRALHPEELLGSFAGCGRFPAALTAAKEREPPRPPRALRSGPGLSICPVCVLGQALGRPSALCACVRDEGVEAVLRREPHILRPSPGRNSGCPCSRKADAAGPNGACFHGGTGEAESGRCHRSEARLGCTAKIPLVATGIATPPTGLA